ncbi:MAG TPA: DUF2726 domain-containing protein [Rickettsiales bacterium]|nr:DUF2726 domain-containing protein [Rickettsiales bacterium]
MNNIQNLFVSELLKHPGIIAIFIVVLMLKILLLFFPNKRRYRNHRNNTKNQAQLRSQSSKLFADAENLPITATDGLMNQSERKIFQMLLNTLPDPQVSFNALITHAHNIRNSWRRNTVRKNFNTKSVDFVICDKDTFRVIAIVEYDGQGHNNKDDALRDRILQGAGYRIERFNETDTHATIQERFRWLRSGDGPLLLTVGDFPDESPRLQASKDTTVW